MEDARIVERPTQNSDADRRVAAMAALSLSGVGLQASPSRQSAHLLVTLVTHDVVGFIDRGHGQSVHQALVVIGCPYGAVHDVACRWVLGLHERLFA